jgi:hypothetical protein
MYELILEQAVDTPRLRWALATALGVDEFDVWIVEEIDESTPRSPVLVTARELAAGFRLLVSIYVQSNVLETRLASSVSRAVGARVLISDDDIDPYSWLLVDRGDVTRVWLDVGALDGGEYVIGQRADRPLPSGNA